MTPDMMNGGFEAIGAVMLARNVWQLYKDKIVRGVHWWATAFFMSWGYWNLYFYPAIDQWFSFFGGIAVVLVNTIWLVQMLYYNWRERIGHTWQPPLPIGSDAFGVIYVPGHWQKKMTGDYDATNV